MNKSTRLLRMAEVMHRTGMAKSTMYLAIKDKTFPSPIRINPRAVAWPEQVIQEWIDSKITEPEQAAKDWIDREAK